MTLLQRLEKIFQCLHGMDCRMQITLANFIRSRIEPYGKHPQCIRDLDILLEAISYHQGIGSRDAKIIQNVMIKLLAFWQICILEAIDAREIALQSTARQCATDL